VIASFAPAFNIPHSRFFHVPSAGFAGAILL
jgi:hypothetical protein